MLELKKITKIYKTGEFKQTALDNITVNFRKNEFVSILGPSGSGKTTLLNIIGGLDKYTSGDLVINELSTKEFKDVDWDTFRNHRVGFVFQSYNLIAHQTILSNVELALTLSGVTKEERTKNERKNKHYEEDRKCTAADLHAAGLCGRLPGLPAAAQLLDPRLFVPATGADAAVCTDPGLCFFRQLYIAQHRY